MKKFISLILISSISFINPIGKIHGKQINNNINAHALEECQNPNIENQSEIELGDFKKIYLKIIENLSFRNTLWEQSSNLIKISNKDEIANLWGNGIMNKNGTILFLISNDNIKSQLKNLFKDNTSWFLENDKYVIESFKVSKSKKLSKNIFSYEITYKSINVDGYPQTSKQKISVENSNGISKICEFSNIITQN